MKSKLYNQEKYYFEVGYSNNLGASLNNVVVSIDFSMKRDQSLVVTNQFQIIILRLILSKAIFSA